MNGAFMNEVLDLYAAGKSINMISKSMGLSPYHITKILKANNIEIRIKNYQALSKNVKFFNGF